jgi:pimeloyl-ACP methyl ester carboxylesterase
MAGNVPIVFLPGVMGSRLHFPNSDRDWDPDSTRSMAGWIPLPFFRPASELRLQLHVDEPAEVMNQGPLGHGWDGVPQSFYKSFLVALKAGPPSRDVYAIGYDWRQDMWVTTAAFQARLGAILGEIGTKQVDVVTHSMGGLVLRAALARTPGLKDQVRRVVHVCQPVYGAVVLYRRFFTGVVSHLDGSPFSPSDVVFGMILGGDAIDFAGNMSGLPGPMQLLPNSRFPDGGPSGPWNPFPLATGTIYDLYGARDRPPSLLLDALDDDVRDDLVRRLVEVRALHSRLMVTDAAGRIDDVRHPETWAIFGTGRKTDMAVRFDGDDPPASQGLDGDGTVPRPSGGGLFPNQATAFDSTANLATQRQFVVTDIDHSMAMNDPTVLRCVRTILS